MKIERWRERLSGQALRSVAVGLLVVATASTMGGCYAGVRTNDSWERMAKLSSGGRNGSRRRGGPRSAFAFGDPSRDRFRGVLEEGTGAFVSSRSPYAIEPMTNGVSGVTLNLVDVPVNQAAKFVLGDLLNLNYLVDDSLTGRLTLQTTQPVSHDVLVDVFEAALAANGAAIVNQGGVYRILPVAEAIAAGAPVSVPSVASGGPGTMVHVVEIRHISAEQIRNIIEPISPPGSILRVDPDRNLLVLAGNRAELAAMHDAISIFDVDWMRGMSFALHPVRTSDPEAIAEELATIFGTRDGPLKDVVRFVPNARLNAVLVMSKKPKYMRRAAEWIAKLDKAAQSSEDQLFVYDIQNRSASELATLLQSILTSEGGGRGRGVAPRLAAVTVDVDGEESGAGVGATAAFRTETGGQVRVVADEANNSLLVYATSKDYERILPILEKLDVLPGQVLLEAVIAEVSLTDELQFGLRWFFERGKHRTTFSDVASGATGSNFPGFSWVFSSMNIQVALNALSSVTDVNVISSPTLMVLDNKTATLQVGAQVPIVTQSARSVGDPDAPIVNSVELKDTGVILSVTPRVNDSGRVVLEIAQEVSDVVRTTSSGIDSPTIQQRKLNTTVVVNDGESLALGGLIQQSDNVSRAKVPILGDIPLIGNAFKSKTDRIQRTELIIFIQPRVVRDIGEARQVTDEFRRQLNLQVPSFRKAKTRLGRDVRRLTY